VCFVMVNRGAFVVDCVVNVVCWMSLFRGLKMGQRFELYFGWVLGKVLCSKGKVCAWPVFADGAQAPGRGQP
jgi:hypothetical protein